MQIFREATPVCSLHAVLQCCSGSVNNYTDGDTADTRLSPCSADNTHYAAVLQCLCQFLLSEAILVSV